MTAGDTSRQVQASSRLAIGPSNTAGQAYQWAEACKRHLGVDAFAFAGTRRAARLMDGPSHRRIPHHRVRPRAIRNMAIQGLLTGVSHLIVDSFTSLFQDPRKATLAADLRRLREMKIKTGTVFHGSEVRSPESHLERVAHSFYRLLSDEEVLRFAAAAARLRKSAIESGIPLFVTTPDLLIDLPGATWLPLSIQVDSWTCSVPALNGQRPTVLHLPSRRHPPIKGTSYVDPVLERLDDEGLLTYLSPNRVPHEQVPDLVRSSDIVIDQILTGSYGVGAIEAMAAGRLVIGYVDAQTRAHVPWHIPIIDCTPDSLEVTLRDICADLNRYRSDAAAGPVYVDMFHNGREAARELAGYLEIG